MKVNWDSYVFSGGIDMIMPMLKSDLAMPDSHFQQLLPLKVPFKGLENLVSSLKHTWLTCWHVAEGANICNYVIYHSFFTQAIE